MQFHEAFHPSTRLMLNAAKKLREFVDPENVESFETLIPRLFTGRAQRGMLMMDTCGRETARLIGVSEHGRDLFTRFARVDRAALQALMLQAQLCQTAGLARISARVRHDCAIECELVLAPLLQRDDGSEAVLGLLQPVRPIPLVSQALELRLLAIYPIEGQIGPALPRLVRPIGRDSSSR